MASRKVSDAVDSFRKNKCKKAGKAAGRHLKRGRLYGKICSDTVGRRILIAAESGHRERKLKNA